jgi:hypothetical protein
MFGDLRRARSDDRLVRQLRSRKLLRHLRNILEELVDVQEGNGGDLVENLVRIFVPNSTEGFFGLAVEEGVEEDDDGGEFDEFVAWWRVENEEKFVEIAGKLT